MKLLKLFRIHYHKVKMLKIPRNSKRTFTIFLLVISVGFISEFSFTEDKEDLLFKNVFPTLTVKTPYTLMTPYYPEDILISEGQLSHFYTCLKTYRSISERRIDKKGKIIRLRIFVSKDTFIRVSAVSDEVVSFSIEVIDREGLQIDSSNNYAVNCNISLLKKIN